MRRYAAKQVFHLLMRKSWQLVGKRVRVEVCDSAGRHPDGGDMAGYSMPETGVVRVDRRQSPEKVVNTIVHEVAHTVCPDLDEAAVEVIGDLSAKIIGRLFDVRVRP